jgi:uncharacterized protein YecE (DUF72 family)
VVLAADSHHPQIADLTAPFVYVRAMGARTTEKFGYTDAEIDLWAARAKLWASGGRRMDWNTSIRRATTAGRAMSISILSAAKNGSIGRRPWR